MESVNLNHLQILTSSSKTPTPQNTSKTPEDRVLTANNAASPSTIVTLSPAASQLSHDYQMTSRFASMEEQSEHMTRLAATWVTLEELENGTRRPFASAEDERLSRLTLKELMEEGSRMPNADENGHLKSGFAGTLQSDRINVAVANILLEAQHNYSTAAKDVTAAVEEFKEYMKEEFNIDPDSYDILFKDGKPVAVSKGNDGLNNEGLKKVQEVLDNPEDIKSAEKLLKAIDIFNGAALKVIENSLTQYMYGASQNRYLPKEISADWLMEGMNFSHASTSSHVHDKFLTIMADGREKYHAALKDGSHLENGNTDSGILELTKMRELQTRNI